MQFFDTRTPIPVTAQQVRLYQADWADVTEPALCKFPTHALLDQLGLPRRPCQATAKAKLAKRVWRALHSDEGNSAPQADLDVLSRLESELLIRGRCSVVEIGALTLRDADDVPVVGDQTCAQQHNAKGQLGHCHRPAAARTAGPAELIATST